MVVGLFRSAKRSYMEDYLADLGLVLKKYLDLFLKLSGSEVK